MKKSIISLSLLLIMFSAVPANARMVTDSSKLQVRQERMEALEVKKQERIEIKEQKREKLQQKLQEKVSERKQKLTGKVNDKLDSINEKSITSMNKMLERMSLLLEKLADRVEKMEENDKDMSVTTAAIATAETAIATAQAAVDEQAGKIYTIEFEDESGLRVGASTAKTSLRSDLQVVKDLVKAARKAVVTALGSAKASVSTDSN
ncbi:hypothetical protein ACFL18_01240 [Patescibacteria group bacterium]